ncbi:MAG TPA: hypothetical protein VD737_10825, partial [Steroidobacteraceae bacterium]|nr:hypothetical protein [Steroidobacteraceae bacterium]
MRRILESRPTQVGGGALRGRQELQDRLLDALFELRERKTHAVVMVVTGVPTAGRSEVVNELLSWLDPKQVDVYGFRACNEEELARPPLWRYWRILPPKGRIAILHGGWHQDLLQQGLAR